MGMMSGKQFTNKHFKQQRRKGIFKFLTLLWTTLLLTASMANFSQIFSTPPAQAAALNIEILNNITTTNNSNTTTTNRMALGSQQNVNFKITGDQLANVSVLTGSRYAVVTVPNQLLGQVQLNGNATINTNLLIDYNKVGGLQDLLTTVTNLVTTVTNILSGSLGALTNVTLDVTSLNAAVAKLHGDQNITGVSFSKATQLSSDGVISAPLDDELGKVLNQNLITTLQTLKTAVNGLHATANNTLGNVLAALINTTLAPLKTATTTAIDAVLTPLLAGTSPVTSELIDVSVLGHTEATIPTVVHVPSNLAHDLDARFVGTVVRTSALNLSILNSSANASYVYMEGLDLDTTPPDPPTVSISGNSAAGYIVTGKAEANSIVEIKNSSGTVIGRTVASTTGDYTINLPGSTGASKQLSATATDGAGNVSTATSFSTPADPTDPGTLAIDFASNIDFQTQKISTKDQTYFAKLSERSAQAVPNYLQITDGTWQNAGWSVNVTQLDNFKNNGHSLSNAAMTFSNGNATKLSGSETQLPTVENNFTLQPGVSTPVATASPSHGNGTWIIQFGVDQTSGANAISFNVDGASTKDAGSYSTTLQWNLSQTPTKSTIVN